MPRFIRQILFQPVFEQQKSLGDSLRRSPRQIWHSLSDKYSKERARNIFDQKYLVSPKKLDLVVRGFSKYTRMTITGLDGQFRLSVPKDAGQLEISYVGYETAKLVSFGNSLL